MITDELVEQALKLVAQRGGNYEYFFSKLSTPDWIFPLQKIGRFLYPPPTIIEGHYLRFPRWPEGEYLVRMATIAPEEVFNAIDANAYESDNESVHEILLDIAALLPINLSMKVAQAEARWATKQSWFRSRYDEKLIPVVNKLAREGSSHVALELLSPMLQLRVASKEENDSEFVIEGQTVRFSADPVGVIDPWNMQRLLQSVSKSLAEYAPEEFLGLVSRTLATAIQIHDNERGNEDDYSTIWRPRIQSERFRDVLDVLVTEVRDVAVTVAGKHDCRIVLKVFAECKWPIFRRLEYYVLSETDKFPDNFIDHLVSRKDLYESPFANPEFNDFLAKISVHLSADTQEKLLAIIDAGPELSKYSNFLDSQGETREKAEKGIVDTWRLAWLSVLTKILTDKRSHELEVLIKKYGIPEPQFSSGAFAVGHTAALSSAELQKFSLPNLVEYLKEWKPPQDNHPAAPSRAGLGQALQSWVSEQPALFSDNLSLFLTLDIHPTYLRSILDGFTSQLKGERQFDPYSVAVAIEWLLLNTNNAAPEPYKWNEDPGWNWAHMSSARFLSELFLHDNRLDVRRYGEFWASLKLISENPSPSEKDEEEYRKQDDVGMLALNSTRPVGLEAVMRYARWLKMHAPNLEVNSTGLPEVFALLAAHLDPKVDNSVAVREMFGMQFTLLAWLDQHWLENQLHNLFPEKQFRVLDRFAWNAYLRFSRALSAMLPAMRFRYKRGIHALQGSDELVEVSDSERSLGNHLILFYSWGTIEQDDELLTLFFQKASPALKSQTIGDVGWQLGQESTALDSRIQQRLMSLWEHRLASGMQHVSEFRKELAGFGWWFACKKFPTDWSVNQLVTVLNTFRAINPDFAVVKRLAEIATEYPFEAVRCLGIIFEEDREGWAIHGWGDSPQIIIHEALKGDEKSRAEATRVVDILVARGHRGFRNLLRILPT